VTPSDPHSPRQLRSGWLVVTAGVLLALGHMTLVGNIILLLDDDADGTRPDFVDFVISGSLFVAGLGLIRRRRWAWVLGMTIGAVALVSGTVAILDFDSSTTTRLLAVGLAVAPGGVLVAILLRRDVRRSLHSIL
jgi:peptidoglycan/LPS O-acetylase OafA/YrhL